MFSVDLITFMIYSRLFLSPLSPVVIAYIWILESIFTLNIRSLQKITANPYSLRVAISIFD